MVKRSCLTERKHVSFREGKNVQSNQSTGKNKRSAIETEQGFNSSKKDCTRVPCVLKKGLKRDLPNKRGEGSTSR